MWRRGGASAAEDKRMPPGFNVTEVSWAAESRVSFWSVAGSHGKMFVEGMSMRIFPSYYTTPRSGERWYDLDDFEADLSVRRAMIMHSLLRGLASDVVFYSCVLQYKHAPNKKKANKINLTFLQNERGGGVPYSIDDSMRRCAAFELCKARFKAEIVPMMAAARKAGTGILRRVTAFTRKPPMDLFDGLVKAMCATNAPLFLAVKDFNEDSFPGVSKPGSYSGVYPDALAGREKREWLEGLQNTLGKLPSGEEVFNVHALGLTLFR